MKIRMVYYDNIGRNLPTLKKYRNRSVKDVIVKLNDRPRKKLDYNTPAKLMAEHMAAIAA